MKMKTLFAGCLLASMAWAPARTWTSSDGGRTFEGDLKDFEDASGKVTILVDGRNLIFNQDKLSEDDKTYLTEWKAEAAKAGEEPNTADGLASQKVSKALTDKVLSRLNGEKFEHVSMKKAPEYYLLYFSASW